MEFWRGEAYTAYVDYLERTGGFYYEVRSEVWLSLGDISLMPFVSIPPFAEMGRRTCTHHGGLPLPPKRQNPLLQQNRIHPRTTHPLSARSAVRNRALRLSTRQEYRYVNKRSVPRFGEMLNRQFSACSPSWTDWRDWSCYPRWFVTQERTFSMARALIDSD